MAVYLVAPGRSARRPETFCEPRWESPQAQGLVQWIQAPFLWDPVRQAALTRAGTTSVSRQATPEGVGLRTTANNDYWSFPALALPTTGFSIAWWGIKVTTAAPYVYMSSGNTTSQFSGLMLNLGDAGNWFAQHGDNTGTASSDYRRASSGSTLAVSRFYHLVAVCRGDTDWSLYQDGVPLTPSYSGSGGAKADAATAGALGRGGTATNAPNAITLDCRVYNRALTDADVQHLFQPMTRWDLYRQASRTAMVSLGGAVAYEIDAQPGSVTLTGVQAGVVAGRVINAETGAWTWTGVQAGLAYQPALNAQPGAMTLTGIAATLPAVTLINAQPGAYTLTGVVAGVAWQPALNAEVGVYTLTGIDATLEDDAGGGVAYELDAQPGAYTLTGVAATLAWQPVLSADPGAVTLTGVSAGVVLGAVLSASPGSVTLTGSAAGVALGAALNAASGAVTLTGVSAGLVASWVVAADPGSYVLTGVTAGLDASSDVAFDWIALSAVAVDFPALSGGAVTFPQWSGLTVTVPRLSAVDVETPED